MESPRIESSSMESPRFAAAGAIYAEAGVASPKVARFAALHDLAGAEFLAGIPGTVGGALAMNAGCYGGETWDIVANVTTVGPDVMALTTSGFGFCAAAVVATSTAHIAKPR